MHIYIEILELDSQCNAIIFNSFIIHKTNGEGGKKKALTKSYF